jgi:hypothetical protein
MDKLPPPPKRPLVKGPLKPPLGRVNPSSYTENRPSSTEVTFMKQDWQSDPASKTALEMTSWSSNVFHLQFLTTPLTLNPQTKSTKQLFVQHLSPSLLSTQPVTWENEISAHSASARANRSSYMCTLCVIFEWLLRRALATGVDGRQVVRGSSATLPLRSTWKHMREKTKIGRGKDEPWFLLFRYPRVSVKVHVYPS